MPPDTMYMCNFNAIVLVAAELQTQTGLAMCPPCKMDKFASVTYSIKIPLYPVQCPTFMPA